MAAKQTATRFDGFSRELFTFLEGLEADNSKTYWDANKATWEASVREPVEALMAELEPEFGPLRTFRPNRDVRFSKDKTPYKTNMGASFIKGGKKAPGAGFYFHCEPGKSFAGGGTWMPEELGKIRQEIDYNFGEWKKITENKHFKKLFPTGVEGAGDDLTRPPKGYDDQNPAIRFLKMKSYIVTRDFTDEEIQSKSLLKEVLKTFETMKEFIAFLNRSIE